VAHPATNRVTGHLALPSAGLSHGEASVGAGEGSVWLVTDGPSCAACLVARVDPRSLRVVARVAVREGAAAVRDGHGAVWVTNPTRSVVQKIDARRNRVAATTRVRPQPRIDPEANSVVNRYGPASGSGAVIVGFGAVWLSAHDVETVWCLPLENP
jgi:hypothetical protein